MPFVAQDLNYAKILAIFAFMYLFAKTTRALLFIVAVMGSFSCKKTSPTPSAAIQPAPVFLLSSISGTAANGTDMSKLIYKQGRLVQLTSNPLTTCNFYYRPDGKLDHIVLMCDNYVAAGAILYYNAKGLPIKIVYKNKKLTGDLTDPYFTDTSSQLQKNYDSLDYDPSGRVSTLYLRLPIDPYVYAFNDFVRYRYPSAKDSIANTIEYYRALGTGDYNLYDQLLFTTNKINNPYYNSALRFAPFISNIYYTLQLSDDIMGVDDGYIYPSLIFDNAANNLTGTYLTFVPKMIDTFSINNQFLNFTWQDVAPYTYTYNSDSTTLRVVGGLNYYIDYGFLKP